MNTEIEEVIEGANAHGRLSEPGHEVGDLQIALRLAWRLMTAKQRQSYLEDPEIQEIIEWSVT